MSIIRFITIFFIISSKNTFGASYTLSDLDILYKDKSYEEYISHALDIRPSLRNKSWKKMTKEMALLAVEEIDKKSPILKDDINILNKIEKIHFLSDQVIINMKIGIIYAKLLNQCKEKCDNYLTQYLLRRKYYRESDIEIYFKFKDIDPRAHALLKEISHDKNADLFCKRDKVKFFLLKEFKKQTDLKSLRALSSKKCLSSMKEDLLTTLIEENHKEKSNDQFIQLLTELLTSSKVLNEQEEDLVYTLYLLGNPYKSKVFNKAWTRLEKISQNYKRREKVLEDLVKIDPLQDRILQNPNKKKMIAVINHFKRNFPEYFNEYARTCVNFLEGNGEFPFGNPTVRCEKYFSLSKSSDWISDSIRSRYSSAKKL